MKESDLRGLQRGSKFTVKRPAENPKYVRVKKNPWLTSGMRIIEQLSTWVIISIFFGLGYLAATAVNYL